MSSIGRGSRGESADPALSGLRVVDLSRLVPGAYCTLILAKLGADVIKVEEPGTGDYLRWRRSRGGEAGRAFAALNRNKRSLTLNLKSEQGREIFLRLAATADVVIESFRPGVSARLSADYGTLSGIRPDLIYCAISGYGQEGPYRTRAGHDINYLALAGVLDLLRDEGGRPVTPGIQIADVATGLWATIGILAALVQRCDTGRGSFLDLSMQEAALSFLACQLAEQAEGPHHPLERSQRTPEPDPWCAVYETRDGRHMALGASEEKFRRAFSEAVGRPDLVEARDPLVARQALARLFAARTRDEWLRALRGVDGCCDPVWTLHEVLQDPQLIARGDLVYREVPGKGMIPQVRMPTGHGHSRSGEDWPPPGLGEHTRAILGELGYGNHVEELQRAGIV